METVVSVSTAQPRAMMWLFVGFGGLALVLALIGTYGVVSYSAAQRTYEMGVRIALGATRGRVFRMVLRQSLGLVMCGIAVGAAASLVVNRLLTKFLYGVAANDPGTIATVSLLMLAVALAGGYFPARRAAAVNPLVTLRVE
jgi:ABC-type antimicrobial peptide transport system permease subunit